MNKTKTYILTTAVSSVLFTLHAGALTTENKADGASPAAAASVGEQLKAVHEYRESARQQFDWNHDGVLDPSEIAAYEAAVKNGSFPVPPESPALSSEVLQKYDENGDGKLDSDELLKLTVDALGGKLHGSSSLSGESERPTARIANRPPEGAGPRRPDGFQLDASRGELPGIAEGPVGEPSRPGNFEGARTGRGEPGGGRGAAGPRPPDGERPAGREPNGRNGQPDRGPRDGGERFRTDGFDDRGERRPQKFGGSPFNSERGSDVQPRHWRHFDGGRGFGEQRFGPGMAGPRGPHDRGHDGGRFGPPPGYGGRGEECPDGFDSGRFGPDHSYAWQPRRWRHFDGGRGFGEQRFGPRMAGPRGPEDRGHGGEPFGPPRNYGGRGEERPDGFDSGRFGPDHGYAWQPRHWRHFDGGRGFGEQRFGPRMAGPRGPEDRGHGGEPFGPPRNYGGRGEERPDGFDSGRFGPDHGYAWQPRHWRHFDGGRGFGEQRFGPGMAGPQGPQRPGDMEGPGNEQRAPAPNSNAPRDGESRRDREGGFRPPMDFAQRPHSWDSRRPDGHEHPANPPDFREELTRPRERFSRDHFGPQRPPAPDRPTPPAPRESPGAGGPPAPTPGPGSGGEAPPARP